MVDDTWSTQNLSLVNYVNYTYGNYEVYAFYLVNGLGTAMPNK